MNCLPFNFIINMQYLFVSFEENAKNSQITNNIENLSVYVCTHDTVANVRYEGHNYRHNDSISGEKLRVSKRHLKHLCTHILVYEVMY